MVRAAFAGRDLRFVEQKEQLGTGHALMVALPELKRAGMKKVLVVNGDTPLITTDTLRDFMFYAEGADVSVATLTLENPGAYGRIVRQNGELRAIVEAKDFDVAVHGEPTGEINAGIYMLNLEAVEILVPKLGNENKSGEYYITDLVGMAVAEGIDDIGGRPRRADAGAAVRHGGAMAHPDLDAVGGEVARQVGEDADQVVAQDFGALPVGRVRGRRSRLPVRVRLDGRPVRHARCEDARPKCAGAGVSASR